jgi:AraC-like DNA-binding protein
MAISRDSVPGWEPRIELLAYLRPYVRQCGDRPRASWRIPERKLLDYLLVYIAEGSGRFTVGGTAYDAAPGDLFWIPPDTLHEMEGFPPRMVCPYVHFDLAYRPERSHWDFTIPGGTRELRGLEGLMHPRPEYPELEDLNGRLRIPTAERTGNLIREICAEAARAQPYASLRMSGLMLQIVGEVLRGKQGLAERYSHHLPALEAAAEHLRRQLGRDASVEEAAEICELSPSHFRKIFQAHFGVSPRAYLRAARIRRAKELMLATTQNLSQIGRAVGFATVHSFSRAFRAEEGLCPSEYRHCGSTAIYVQGRATRYPR